MRIEIHVHNDDGMPEAEFAQLRKFAIVTMLVGMCKTDGMTMDQAGMFTAAAIARIWHDETLTAERVDGPSNATQH